MESLNVQTEVRNVVRKIVGSHINACSWNIWENRRKYWEASGVAFVYLRKENGVGMIRMYVHRDLNTSSFYQSRDEGAKNRI